MIHTGFEPYVNGDSKILILGSFPSIKSREEGFYYGNRQNRFWKILSESFDSEVPQNIKDKKALLNANKIALWEIVISCEINGSMDKDIRNPTVADIPSLMSTYPIKRIITNGATASKLLRTYYPQYNEVSLALPSTSPANVKLDKTLWINVLRSTV